MRKEIFINESSGETRIAILEDSQLVEFYVEKPENERMVGNIYLGQVENVINGMQAAFVDIGHETNAFLPFSEIEDNNYPFPGMLDAPDDEDNGNFRSRGRNRAHPGLKSGEDIIVQVIKEPYRGKGPRVTTAVSIPGRFMVLLPYADHVGVSRKINNRNEKRRLKRIGYEIKPENYGLIVRTVADGKSKEELQSDIDYLISTWKKVDTNIKKGKAPCIVYKDMEMASSIIRDVFTSDVDRVICDEKKLFKKLTSYLKSTSPQLVDKLHRYDGRDPIFDKYNIDKEIEKSLNRKVWLKSGGHLVIEHTEAMVTIDVNSGKFIGRKNHEQNSLKINMEAAREIARQLRLRDIGGLIVVDFIDLQQDRNKKKLYDEMKKETKKDRAKIALAQVSEFGLMEMTRQRVRLSLLLSTSEECPICRGTGRVPSKESMVTKIESWIKRFKSECNERRLILKVHPTIGDYLTEGTKSIIRRLMWHHIMKIDVEKDEAINIDEFRFISKKRKQEITDQY
ncbi:MAG: Rne/Rng family ribonuclease [Candidatus Marinimicrobia bacterium]|nr:Rne/Rng family ribonuclease [Candidatus Neomarinimicrobiota bacterium]MCF7829220.1 Rne/Rng family ribonuclease [Candidatus Neomarinimicrobiota bacterium]MCF7881127.1 Rne/Rng family ribonuclease [Candidatus Neomarinimicrobiota bacterium]